MNILSYVLAISSCFFVALNIHGQNLRAQLLIDHVKNSIHNASIDKSKLSQEVLSIKGWSSSKGRHLLNNLCSLPGICYLEIGLLYGSTFISALYKNTHHIMDAVAIDNWSDSQTGNEFYSNTSWFLPRGSFRFYETNSFECDLQKIFKQPVDIYFYDGHHSFESQKKAFTYFDTVFAPVFITIVDDWIWKTTQEATKEAFKELGYTVLFEEILPSYGGNEPNGWWNGMYVAVIEKPIR